MSSSSKKQGPVKGVSAKKPPHKFIRDSIQGITKPAIRRLSKRAGVLSLGDLSVVESRIIIKTYLENVLRNAVDATEYRRAKTVSPEDVKFAFEQRGINILYSQKVDQTKIKSQTEAK